jgi:hypothetical protein
LWNHYPTPTSMVWKNSTNSPVPSHDQCRVATTPKLHCLDGFLGFIQSPSFKGQLARDTCVEFQALLSCIIWLGLVFLPLNSAHNLHDFYFKNLSLFWECYYILKPGLKIPVSTRPCNPTDEAQ